ncbi:hypothetical protein F4805DRAFT_463570 [Annulohypoxylon moriforme]|nr:hypothetical protein F4805DRAFT_463570 [Annulohypoxylon moriforme]
MPKHSRDKDSKADLKRQEPRFIWYCIGYKLTASIVAGAKPFVILPNLLSKNTTPVLLFTASESMALHADTNDARHVLRPLRLRGNGLYLGSLGFGLW